ncbi:hypothetical protein TorRG33x02_172670, partial [Trema orientale]
KPRREWPLQRKCPFSFDPEEELDEQLLKAFDQWMNEGLQKDHQENLSTRAVTVYDSLKSDKDTRVKDMLEAVATFLPILLDSLSIFMERKDENGPAPFKIEHCFNNPQQDNG